MWSYHISIMTIALPLLGPDWQVSYSTGKTGISVNSVAGWTSCMSFFSFTIFLRLMKANVDWVFHGSVNGHDEDCGRKMRIPEKPDLFTSFIKEWNYCNLNESRENKIAQSCWSSCHKNPVYFVLCKKCGVLAYFPPLLQCACQTKFEKLCVRSHFHVWAHQRCDS